MIVHRIIIVSSLLLIDSTWGLNLGHFIIGGQPATLGNYPFMVAINRTTEGGNFFCGGAILNSQWILTSATCVEKAITLKITIGSLRLFPVDSPGMVISTGSYIQHPDFDKNTLVHDIALIHTHSAIPYTDYVNCITLLTNDILDYHEATALGWGQISEQIGGFNNFLNKVNLTALPNDDCEEVFEHLTEKMLCVGGNSEGICVGDLGGPLVYYVNGKHPVIAGVASFISWKGCEVDRSSFTRVYPYKEWIKKNTGIEDDMTCPQ